MEINNTEIKQQTWTMFTSYWEDYRRKVDKGKNTVHCVASNILKKFLHAILLFIKNVNINENATSHNGLKHPLLLQGREVMEIVAYSFLWFKRLKLCLALPSRTFFLVSTLLYFVKWKEPHRSTEKQNKTKQKPPVHSSTFGKATLSFLFSLSEILHASVHCLSRGFPWNH